MTEIETETQGDNEMELDEAEDIRQEQEENGMTNGDEPTKKRRRIAKPNSDKKFECKHEGCGKSYSRAEHLYRHQLNHTPKNIYRCDFPDCSRWFVRQDLCIRHRERHSTHGSQLNKRDAFAQSATDKNITSIKSRPMSNGTTDSGQSVTISARPSSQSTQVLSPPVDPSLENSAFSSPDAPTNHSRPFHTMVSASVPNETQYHMPTPQQSMGRSGPSLHRSSSNGSNQLSPEQRPAVPTWPTQARRDSFMSADGNRLQNGTRPADNRSTSMPGQGMAQSPGRKYSFSSSSASHTPLLRAQSDNHNQNYAQNHSYMQHAPLPPQAYHPTSYHTPVMPPSTDGAFAAAVSQGLTTARSDTFPYHGISNTASAMDVNAGYGYTVFGGENWNQTPIAIADDFTAWLFNENQPAPVGISTWSLPGFNDSPASQIQGPFFTQSPTSQNNYTNATMQHPMSVTSILDSSPANQYIMSEEKRQELLDIIQNQFVERPHDAVKKRKDSIFEGDMSNESHILSLRMMHTYIGSYWYHQHAQLPILHKPTFSADKTPNLLLLAVIAIGAATMDKAYGTALTDFAAEFANFLAWHIRWEIVRDADFRPPAKLWVFQTLLLIEVYEKMYSTRALHERAHIHHDSTLTLMRRGSSLLGRSASDSPGSPREEKVDQSTSVPEAKKAEESWHRWITTEATRRAAFAAFVLDSIHATMFGHAAKMVAHEMRLPLPCDEGLWSAVSPAEASRVQMALQTNGIRPIFFLDALKKTLSSQRVRTNSFGRTIIMAGLLSVSWHMTQRDLQMSSLGPRTANSIGGPDKWKGTLLRAFDNWKRDFDEALAEATPGPPSPLRTPIAPSTSLLRPVDDENIFESRTVLHHLAHIAAHVDVVDCQVYAGANRLLGRSITPKDYGVIKEKIERWATKASARDAAFYALKFIAQVLTPPNDGEGIDSRYGHASPILPQAFDQNQYIARDDFLLNRPWVLYISALVVWCYGFALDGPIHPPPDMKNFETYHQKEADMKDFLTRVAGVRAPDDLESVYGKNRCLGLLLILKESFDSTRWELTHEAAGLLNNAALKLCGVEDGPVLRNGVAHEASTSGDHTVVANAARI